MATRRPRREISRDASPPVMRRMFCAHALVLIQDSCDRVLFWKDRYVVSSNKLATCCPSKISQFRQSLLEAKSCFQYAEGASWPLALMTLAVEGSHVVALVNPAIAWGKALWP